MKNCCSKTSSGAIRGTINLRRTASPASPDAAVSRVQITDMCCPVEEQMIQRRLGDMPGVEQLSFNLMQRVLTVRHQPAAQQPMLAALRELGFAPRLLDAAQPTPVSAKKPLRSWPLLLAACAAALAEAAHWFGLHEGVQAALAALAIVACGVNTWRRGWLALRNGNLNINALMSIAVTGALLIGQWPEAAMVMVLFTLAERLEARSQDRARNAVAALMDLAPPRARVRQADGSWQTLPVQEVMPGSTVNIRPGERIALDGIITQGDSAIDQAAITGESVPVDKAPGDKVFAGTLNSTGSFDYQVTHLAGESTLANIVAAVEQAQASKAEIHHLVDRFARIYTPVVLALALLVATLPAIWLGDWQGWIYKALVLLVIACPCALVISTPVTLISGLTLAARNGILIKGGIWLESGRAIRWLALDKTGTLTRGQPELRSVQPCAEWDDAQSLALAASLASHSTHPVSQAIGRASTPAMAVSAFRELPGRGIQGTLADQTWWLGNHRLMQAVTVLTPAIEQQRTQLEAAGNTVVMLANAAQVVALFAVADGLKAGSREAIAELHQLGVKTVMLSGDNQTTVAAIAAEVGIDRALGEQLPQDKLDAVAALTQSGTTAMVGDGINDAPALARADIGIAMGVMGSDTALATADVALMDDDLRKLPQFIRCSRMTWRILRQNIALAIGLKVLFLLLTLMGWGTLWMAVFADVGASLLVTANGLRLLRMKL